MREFGVNVVGGCCGSTPAHITALRDAVDAKRRRGTGRAASVNTQSERSEPVPQDVASAMTAVALEQEPRPLLVGERINSQGSRKIKRLLLEDDYDEIMLVAREQVEGGAHVLDVCCALTERTDEDVQMRELVRRLAQSVEAPLMIDSTEPRVDAGRAGELSGPRDRQLGAPRSRAARRSTSCCRWPKSTARRSSR